MKKKIVIIFIIVIMIILLIPKKSMFWDGGTVEYKAALYKITKYHRIDQDSESGYNEGLEIEVLGFMLYDSFIEKQ